MSRKLTAFGNLNAKSGLPTVEWKPLTLRTVSHLLLDLLGCMNKPYRHLVRWQGLWMCKST